AGPDCQTRVLGARGYQTHAPGASERSRHPPSAIRRTPRHPLPARARSRDTPPCRWRAYRGAPIVSMALNPPGVGVVVINWNGLADTMSCLESLVTATPGPARIVVVDNGSTDGSVTRLREWQVARRENSGPTIALLESSTNLGFCGANNIRVEQLRADPAVGYFLLLNNDATVDRTYF